MKRFLVLLGVVLAASTSAADEGTVGGLLRSARTDPDTRLLIFISGESLAWANTYAEAEKSGRMYCPPPKLAMTGEQYAQILTSYVDENSLEQRRKELFPMFLLKALIETFPC